jgi:hypothetical protein
MSFQETSPIILDYWEKNKDQFMLLLKQGEFYNAFALAFLIGSNHQAENTVLKFGYVTNEFCLTIRKLKKLFPVPELHKELDALIKQLENKMKGDGE